MTDSDGANDAQDPGGESGSPRDFAREDLSGREIAGCRLIRKLGQGAMGAVYLAEQISLRRQVAFKVLDPKFSRDLTYIERFEREAQAAALLTHYNIVRVFDYGRQGELYFIVNEYVDGSNVQALIDAEGVVAPAQALDIALQTCQGLAVAQQHTVVHRDIKPDNLMLTLNGVVKIADFGLAKVIHDEAAVTQSGMIVGTPFYMSPEQAKGHELDGRSDIYSLGITFFHMVTGQIPFDADSVVGVLLMQISAERPDPVAINPDLPHALGPVIMKMMARDADERYQSAVELIPVLKKLQSRVQAGAAETQVQLPDQPAGRLERYRPLRSSQIVNIALREVSADVKKKMLALLKADAGVFVETKESYLVDSIVDLRFSVPGREGLFSAIGVVRWLSDDTDREGMGITFLKVGAVPAAASRKSGRLSPTRASERIHTPPSRPRALNAAEAVRALTQSPLHSRLLRYHYANSGQSVDLRQIAGAMGVGVRMLKGPLAVLEQTGLIRHHRSDVIDLIWPDDKSLQHEIVGWVSKYGLL